jgi:PII-like signaling protein
VSTGLELRFHFGERDRVRDGGGDGDRALDVTVMDACARHGVWAAALLRGVEGFGAGAVVRTERVLSLSEDAPLVAVAVGETAKVEALGEEVRAVAGGGLVVLEEVGLMGGTLGDGGRDVVRVNLWGPRDGGRSPHRRAVDALRRHGAEAASVLLGVDGVLDGERSRARFVASNRGVPAITVAVGERGAIDAALAEVSDLADLVTIEGVERNRPYAAEKLHGSGARVTFVTSEVARGDAHPRYLELIHALRREGAAGATALRGVWGFRGDGAPRGDRVLALRRDLPLSVEVVDSAERCARWLEIAEELAGDGDVAYSQQGLRILTLDRVQTG